MARTFKKKLQQKPRSIKQIIHGLVKYYHSKFLKKNTATPHPHDIIWVNPEDITYYPVPRLMEIYDLNHFGSWIIDGEWHTWPISNQKWYKPTNKSKVRLKFENYVFFQSLKKALLENISWSETDYYQWLINESTFDHDWAVADFQQTKDLYNNIKDQGYKRQCELYKMPFRGKYDEIRVSIGPHGSIDFFGGGRHRLSIAKILQLDQIPVRVIVRHTEWQKKRESVKNNTFEDLSSKTITNINHPDLENI